MSWIKQKTTWAGLVLVITGIGEFVCGEDKTKAFEHVMLGLGFIFTRQAIAKGK